MNAFLDRIGTSDCGAWVGEGMPIFVDVFHENF